MNSLEPEVERLAGSLKEALGDNLYSCCLYGSAVRGDAIEGVSDINLLIVLNHSTTDAHLAISRIIGVNPRIDPFVLGRPGFKRSVRAFAPKFLSIRRDYRVLCGKDPLAEINVDPQLERFLCEQALRNLRLRLVFSFITRSRTHAYGVFLAKSVTPLLLRLSEMLRLAGKELPKPLEDRIPIISKELGFDEKLLRGLFDLKKQSRNLLEGASEEQMIGWHGSVFSVLNTAISWMESKWPE